MECICGNDDTDSDDLSVRAYKDVDCAKPRSRMADHMHSCCRD